MKKSNVFGLGVSVALIAAVLSGCASVKVEDMLTKGDPVNNIKKLAKILKKDPTDQAAADVFNELYNRELEKSVDVIAGTPQQVVKDFADAQGADSTFNALKARKEALTDGAQVWDDIAVTQVRSKLSQMELAANDFYLLQSYVEDMPELVGVDPSYEVKKFGYTFITGKQTDIWNAMGNFDFMCAEVMLPARDDAEKAVLYKHFKTAHSHPSKFANKQNAYNRVVELGIELGDSLLNQARDLIKAKDFSGAFNKAFDARVQFEDVDLFDTSKKPAAQKELEGYYVQAESRYEKFQSVAVKGGDAVKTEADESLKDAIKYFGYAKNYSDAAARKTQCEELYNQVNGQF